MGLHTGIVVAATSILLGLVFCHWLVDYGILWVSPLTESAYANALAYYLDYAASPAWLSYLVMGIASLAIVSLFSKLSSFSTSSILFDGGSLVLYIACASAYFTSVREGFLKILQSHTLTSTQTLATLRNLASAHLTISVALTGVVALQAGQYFAERSLMQETGFLDDDGFESTVPSTPRIASPRPSRVTRQTPAAAPKPNIPTVQQPAATRSRKAEAAGASISKTGTGATKTTEIILPANTTQRVTRATSAALAKAQQEAPAKAQPTAAPKAAAAKKQRAIKTEDSDSAILTVVPTTATPAATATATAKKGGRKRRKPPA